MLCPAALHDAPPVDCGGVKSYNVTKQAFVIGGRYDRPKSARPSFPCGGRFVS